MGLGAILTLAVGVFSAVKQNQQAKKARIAQREANAVSGASQEVSNRLARRNEAKRLRITRARIMASATSSGVGESSGEFGATSASTSASNSSVATQQSQVLAAQGITAANQQAANAISRGKSIGAFGGLLQQGIGLADDAGKFNSLNAKLGL